MSLPASPTEPPTRPLLTIELIPETAWGQNLRAILSSRDWDAVRKFSYRRAGYRCECCGGVGPAHPVECHEVWDWLVNSATREAVQVLVGVVALCPTCHSVKHWGRTLAVSPTPGTTESKLLAHIQRVNGWTPPQARHHLRNVFQWWSLASKYLWTLDVQTYLGTAQQAGDFTLRDWSPPKKENPNHDPDCRRHRSFSR